jgi:hypothetical protein
LIGFGRFFEMVIAKNHPFVEDSLKTGAHVLRSGFCGASINLGWSLEFSECRARLKNHTVLRARTVPGGVPATATNARSSVAGRKTCQFFFGRSRVRLGTSAPESRSELFLLVCLPRAGIFLGVTRAPEFVKMAWPVILWPLRGSARKRRYAPVRTAGT